ncbi:MAG: hypothetical protein LBB91_10395 [Clostridiales bacterium]|jgi:hypothetical protein|nr:hypothetical protein [Clostridiales bacterium]
MSKKGVVGLSVALVLVILAITGHRIYEYRKEKRAEDEYYKAAEIELAYGIQNGAFFGLVGYPYHMPYNKDFEHDLQAHIIFYTRTTGKNITLKDVETFLAVPENPDGTPRIWKDDETGVIIDFVEWYKAVNSWDLKHYRVGLMDILVYYCIQNPECPYLSMQRLSPEQIIELDKKYLDPDYDLVLEW